MRFATQLLSSRAFAQLHNDVSTSNLGHAYMLTSSDVGAIEELALLFACDIYCKHSLCMEDDCADCRKVLSFGHSDVHHIYKNADKKSITVDVISKMIDISMLTSYEGSTKMFIVHEADLMLHQAQNKLLKTLEEPTPNVCIVLLVSNPATLLSTIKSRVRSIALDYFEPAVIKDMLTGDPKRIAIAVNCADGSLTRAADILGADVYISQFEKVVQMLCRLKKSKDIALISSMDIFDKDKILTTLSIMEIVMRDFMLINLGDDNLAVSLGIVDEVKDTASTYSIESISVIIDKINQARQKLAVNCITANVIENLLFSFLEVRYKCQ